MHAGPELNGGLGPPRINGGFPGRIWMGLNDHDAFDACP